jgi:pyruvate/2-oxoglutarate dehydrogenase complex dihydrolipoamide acyltransferase (E2) component
MQRDFGIAPDEIVNSAGMIPIVAPDLGLPVATKICGWRAEPGDDLADGETVAEVVAAGVLAEIPTPVPGRLAYIVRGTLCEVGPGDILGWVGPLADPAIHPEGSSA